MKQLKYILPLLLTIITLAIYNPIEAQASTTITPIFYSGEARESNGLIVNNGPATSGNNGTEKINIPLGATFTINDITKISWMTTYLDDVFVGTYIRSNDSSITSSSWYLGQPTNTMTATNFNQIAFSNRADFPSWVSGASGTTFQTLTVSYSNPEPTFGTDTITWNYDPITDELTATFTSNEPTFSVNDISARGVLTGDSRFFTSPSEINVNNATGSHPKVNGFTGTQTFTLTNIPRGESLYMRTYVQYNSQDFFYSEGVTVTPPNYAVRQLDYIDYNGFVIATYYPDIYSDASLLDSQAQPFILGREGYSFSGFTGDSTITTELTVFQRTAQYTELTFYDVTFLDWDNSLIGTVTVQQGETAVPPYIPTRTGYTFSSWLPPVANVQGDITTVAQYTANTYLVTWNSDDVEILANQVAHDVNVLSQAPAITKENHNLVGWTIDPTETLLTSGQVVTGPLSLTAVWEPVPTYTVTWRDTDFSTLKIEYVIESGLAVAPVYSAGSGLQLVGWTPDPTQPITENTTFIAVVEQIPTTPTLPSDYSPISDLFGGVIGASIGAVMTLGTIDLYGIQLSSIIYLFVSMSLGLWILKAIRG